MAAPVITEVDGHQLQLTNLDKVLFPDGTTKAELISHAVAVAPVLLPHLRGRCLTRLRFPDGVEGESFYEKNAPAGTPEWVRTEPVLTSAGSIDYVLADDTATLVWLANLAAIEWHTPQWTVDLSPQRPIPVDGGSAVPANTLVVDLDPGPGVTMHRICRAAMLAAHQLATDGLVPHVKTSGSKGLQVVCRILPTPWTQVVEQTRALGQRLMRQHPDLFTTTMARSAREGLIYWDHLQNRGDRNTISVYSCRGRQSPRMSTPVTWEEVGAVGESDDLSFEITDLPDRLDRHGDLWAPLLDASSAAPLPEWKEEPRA